MTVKELMTAPPKTCTPDTTLAVAARMMWEGDCGVLPVVDEGELVGVVTDRDMYIALATKDERASRVRVGAVATTTVSTCGPDDDVEVALRTMAAAAVRRLPVVDRAGKLVGLLSINDVLLAAGAGKPVDTEDVVAALKVICMPRDIDADICAG